MIFVDASAIVATTAKEEGWEEYARILALAKGVLVSPLSIWEATVALGRNKARSFAEAGRLVEDFLVLNEATTIPITPEIGALAVEASRRYSRGRHPADLNFGDCFAYACARSRGVPLLFKGEDFVHTDIEAA